MFDDYIKVAWRVCDDPTSFDTFFKELESLPIISYDCETQSIYTPEEKKEAKHLLDKHSDDLDPEDKKLSKLVANSSGLSHPAIVKVTHFIFGISESESIILIAYDYATELTIMKWLITYTGKLLVHNSTFDLKLVYDRTQRFPVDYEDTQLLAKCYINDTDEYKARVGLKLLMGDYYDPKWTLIDTYDVEDYLDENFLRYCAIDGASVMLLWEQLQEYLERFKS